MTLASRLSDLTAAIATAYTQRRIGASAYELAVVNGYTGTQAQWLASLALSGRAADQNQWWFEPNALVPTATAGDGSVTLTTTALGRSALLSGVAAFGTFRSHAASLTVAAPAPASGDIWYLIVDRIVWNSDGTTTATPTAISGSTSANTTTPTVPPVSYPATTVFNPGTQVDIPIAWAWMRAGSTAPTVFDQRVQSLGTGVPQVPDLFTLNALFVAGAFSGGAVNVAQFSTTNGIVRSNTWVARGGSGVTAGFRPQSNLRVSTVATLADLVTLVGTLSRVQLLNDETQAQVETTGSPLYRVIAGNFKIWEWNNAQLATTITTNLNNSSGDTNGGDFTVDIVGGVFYLNYNVYRSTGIGLSTSYMQINSGFRPQYSAWGSGTSLGGTTGIHTTLVSATGDFSVQVNTGTSNTAVRGTIFWRIS